MLELVKFEQFAEGSVRESMNLCYKSLLSIELIKKKFIEINCVKLLDELWESRANPIQLAKKEISLYIYLKKYFWYN